jgi:hypothetical protein
VVVVVVVGSGVVVLVVVEVVVVEVVVVVVEVVDVVELVVDVVDVVPVVVDVVVVRAGLQRRWRPMPVGGLQILEQQSAFSRQSCPPARQTAALAVRSSAGTALPATAPRSARNSVRREGVAAMSLVSASKRWSPMRRPRRSNSPSSAHQSRSAVAPP